MGYYERKHEQRTKEAAYLFRFIWLTAIGILIALTLCSRPTTASGQTEPLLYRDSIPPGPYSTVDTARRACDTLIDRTTGAKIPVYNCGKVFN